jgi:hypothetical protein
MARPCKYCAKPNLALDKALVNGAVYPTAIAFKVPPASAANHRRHLMARAVSPETSGRPPPPVMRDLPPGASQLEQAQATVEWLDKRVLWATQHDPKDVSKLVAQKISAQRLLRSLSGGDLSEAQVCKHPAFAKVMGVVRMVLEKHPKARAELFEALEKVQNG